MPDNRPTSREVSIMGRNLGRGVIAGIAAVALLATAPLRAQERRLDRVPQASRPLPSPPEQPVDNSAVEIFELRNPGSAASPAQPGRVRPDAPAQHELGRQLLLERYKGENWARLNEPTVPVPFLEPDPRFQGVMRLTTDSRSDDFPDIASNPRDRSQVWAVWQSYSGRRDQIHLMPFLPEYGNWSAHNTVPGVTGDVWRPRLAFDGDGRVWVIWAQQELYSANFDLYARFFEQDHWGPLHRLTSAPEGDFYHAVARAGDGSIHVVWQGFRDGQSDIFHIRYDGDRWSQPRQISTSAGNDWTPAVAVDSGGSVHIAWDTYDSGNYDVLLRTIGPDDELSPVRVVANGPWFEARPSIAVDAEDRIWVAFEVGEMNWGKDQGQTVVPNPAPGARLNEHRQVHVRVLEGGTIRSAKPEIADMFWTNPPIRYVYEPTPMVSNPMLAVDDAGRVHLAVRASSTQGGGYDNHWTVDLTTMTGEGWTEPVQVPYSDGRLSMFTAAAPAAGGALWLAWPRDNNLTTSIFINLPEETLIENVYAARFVPDSAAGIRLGEPVAPAFPERPVNDPEENTAVARARGWRARVGGRALQILRGDTHRHTELSPDLRAVPDGSALDFYRYMLDAASMDFGFISDHQYGGDREYWWWYTEKLADLFHAPDRYLPLFGYERSVSYPNGHRNIVHDRRGVEHVPFFLDQTLNSLRMHNGCSEVTADDTKSLYEALRKTGGIAIPHTSATIMGTDWRDNDPEVEPIVEIFQGDRYSYEAPDAPLTDPGGEAASFLTAVKPAGFVSNAWDKGYRLGVITSSDHLSTHISYAMVWAEERSRGAVLDAMKARHTYGATDNIVLEFWMGEHFMGDEFAAATVPPIRVRAVGTKPVKAIDIIRNNRSIYRNGGGRREVDVTYLDTHPQPGTSFYYVRLEQVDGNVAWSSPIWVRMTE
jgi:hypothetical protein